MAESKKMSKRKGILERLAEGIVVGDGGFCHGLEKRGYVRAGPWTPECVVNHPDAVKQYHREFLRAGSDVMQAYTFFASDNKRKDAEERSGVKVTLPQDANINLSACQIAREVADEGEALVSASLTKTAAYLQGKGEEYVKAEFRAQVNCFVKAQVDFIICEYFSHLTEIEWAIQVAKEAKLPVAASMCIDPLGDFDDVPLQNCVVRMAKAGADIVGFNCNYDLNASLKSAGIMKEALRKEGLSPYMMLQPLGYLTPDIKHRELYAALPEAPYALETRMVTRFEVAKWARECYEAGIHYIGGCCGFEPYHIRAISEELWKERGKKCKATEENGFLVDSLKASPVPFYKPRMNGDYWKQLRPTSGRPYSSSVAFMESDKIPFVP